MVRNNQLGMVYRRAYDSLSRIPIVKHFVDTLSQPEHPYSVSGGAIQEENHFFAADKPGHTREQVRYISKDSAGLRYHNSPSRPTLRAVENQKLRLGPDGACGRIPKTPGSNGAPVDHVF
jgi:hypothetical protein